MEKVFWRKLARDYAKLGISPLNQPFRGLTEMETSTFRAMKSSIISEIMVFTMSPKLSATDLLSSSILMRMADSH